MTKTTRALTRTRPAADLIREIAARDPEAHDRALARGYGVDAPQRSGVPGCEACYRRPVAVRQYLPEGPE